MHELNFEVYSIGWDAFPSLDAGGGGHDMVRWALVWPQLEVTDFVDHGRPYPF